MYYLDNDSVAMYSVSVEHSSDRTFCQDWDMAYALTNRRTCRSVRAVVACR
jgi:hypothetical protein